MNDRIFAVLVLIAILGSSYVINKHQTAEGKSASYSFMMHHMK